MDNEVKEVVKKNAEAEELRDFLRGAMNEEKGIDNFFLGIVKAKDSRKIGNLSDEELGEPILPVRTLLELARDCKDIASLKTLGEDFEAQAEDILATSLSKDGFLIKSRITQRKSLMDGNKSKQKRRGLFGSREEKE